MARTWLTIQVDLVEGHGEHLWPRPGRLSQPHGAIPSRSWRMRSMTRSPLGTGASP